MFEPEVKVAVIVKSSRRPWCLERTLRSLRDNLTDYNDLRVFVADDRTPLDHRKKISKSFPEVHWVLNSSPKPEKNFINNWTTAVVASEASHVLVVEDDQILSKPISVQILATEMRESGCRLLNLNLPSHLVGDDFYRRTWRDFEFFFPRALKMQERFPPASLFLSLFSKPGFWAWKFRALAVTFWPKSTNKLQGDLSLLNGICGVIYESNFWREVWGPRQPAVDEWAQVNRILRAIMSQTAGNRNIVARQLESSFKTTHSSSISTTKGWELDWSKANAVWSTEWLEGRLVFPVDLDDWSPAYLAMILEKHLGEEVGKVYYSWARYFHLRHRGIDIGERVR